jgi:hypothetical protein
MLRALIAVAITAPAGLLALGSSPASAVILGVDVPSFAAGLVAGMAVAHLSHVPWGQLKALTIASLHGIRRNMALFALASAFAGVLLFY